MQTSPDNQPIVKSILEQILDETFKALSDDNQFDAELLSKLSELRANDNLNKASIVARIMPETT